jgi:hypothetical protein
MTKIEAGATKMIPSVGYVRLSQGTTLAKEANQGTQKEASEGRGR